MIPEPAQGARGRGILVLEPGGHVDNEWGAQEGTELCLDLNPPDNQLARISTEPHWAHGGGQGILPGTKWACPFAGLQPPGLDRVPGSGGSRWFCRDLYLPTTRLCMQSFPFLLTVQVAFCGTLPRSRRLFVFLCSPQQFFSFLSNKAGHDNC